MWRPESKNLFKQNGNVLHQLELHATKCYSLTLSLCIEIEQ